MSVRSVRVSSFAFCVASMGCGNVDDDAPARLRNLLYVPQGSFMMGCNPDIESGFCRVDESPYHEVTLSPFEIEETEVTQGAYARCVLDKVCTLPGGDFDAAKRGNFPVTFVVWEQADTYCRWAGGRLPSEAEWEKAARGTDGRIYPWGNTKPTCDLANLDCGDVTHEVGTAPNGRSPYGALDMAGNVMEWVNDWYDPSFYATGPKVDPTGPTTGKNRAQRGGSFIGDAQTVRTSYRVKGFPIGLSNIGFRCARSAK